MPGYVMLLVVPPTVDRQSKRNRHMNNSTPSSGSSNGSKSHLHIPRPHLHITSVFGDGWFGTKAESFARYFGTPKFIVTQTVIVAAWIGVNAAGMTHFDVYPFILLNLAFSLQAAYAAPLILLAQTRQADRDKLVAEADAQHREAIAAAAEQRQQQMTEQTAQLLALMEQNTHLTELTNQLSQRIEVLSKSMHLHIIGGDPATNA